VGMHTIWKFPRWSMGTRQEPAFKKCKPVNEGCPFL